MKLLSEYQDLVSTFERLKDAVGDTESLQATVEKLLATFFSDSQPENAKQQGEIHFTADVNHLIDTINAMDIDNVTTKEFVDVILSIFSEKLTVDSAIDFIKKTAKMKVSEVLNVIDAYLFNQTGKNLQGNYQAIVTSPIFTPLAKELLPIFIGNEKALVVIAMLKGLDVKEFLMTYKDFTVQQLVSSLLGVKVTDPDVLESKLNEYLSTPLKDFEVEGFSPYEYVDVLKSLTKQLILKEGQISAQILYNDYKIDKVCLSTNTCLADIVENLVALENSHTKFYEEKQVKLDCSAEITLNQNFAQITLPENATIRTI